MRNAFLLALALLAPAVSAEQRNAPGEFDFYVLSLSWSPSYCLSNPGDSQCTGKGYGFVLHGLWPQFANNRWPQFCGPFPALTADDRAKGMTLYPSPKLMEHEWKKHGTCSGLGARGYLEASDKALANVAVPKGLSPSPDARRYSAEQVKAMFQQANPAIPADGISVYCARGQLSEVRVCLSKELSPTSCGAPPKGQCKQQGLMVPGVR